VIHFFRISVLSAVTTHFSFRFPELSPDTTHFSKLLAVLSVDRTGFSKLLAVATTGGGRSSLWFDMFLIFSSWFYYSILIPSSPSDLDRTDTAGTPVQWSLGGG
jgi:hypothetical protein